METQAVALTDLEAVTQEGPSGPLLSDSPKETVISQLASYLGACGLVGYGEATSLIPGTDGMLPQTPPLLRAACSGSR